MGWEPSAHPKGIFVLVVTTERTLLPGGELQQPQHCLGCCLCIYSHHLPNSPSLTTNKAEDPYCLIDHIIWSAHSLLIPTDFLPVLVGTMVSSSFFQETMSQSATHPHWWDRSENSTSSQAIKEPATVSQLLAEDPGRLDHRQRTSLLRAQQAAWGSAHFFQSLSSSRRPQLYVGCRHALVDACTYRGCVTGEESS